MGRSTSFVVVILRYMGMISCKDSCIMLISVLERFVSAYDLLLAGE